MGFRGAGRGPRTVPRVAIRTHPDDFRVDEELEPALEASLCAGFSEAAPHAVCRLTKSGITTPDATAGLARALQVPPHAIHYAGLKDRHAATSQHVSFKRPSPAAARALARGIEGPGWRARVIGWSTEPVDASWIAANAFEIVVRDLSAEAVDTMHARAARLRAPDGALHVVNYFGDQRFGSARHGQGFAARALLAGDVDAALRLAVGTPARKDLGVRRAFTRTCAAKWGQWKALAAELPPCPERRPFERLSQGASLPEAFMALPPFLRTMNIEAFQSLLWNDGARRMVRAAIASPIETEDDFGVLAFAPAAEIPAAWMECRPPMPSPETVFAAPWGEAWRAALAAEQLEPAMLTLRDMPELRFGHAERPLVMRAANFAMQPIGGGQGSGNDRAVEVRFRLPRGAYATVLLRALGQ